MGLLDKLMNMLGFGGDQSKPSPRFKEEEEVHQEQRPTIGFPSPIEIQYGNYQGEEKTFVGNSLTLYRKGAHISAEVEPAGIRITLHREKIRNLEEIEPHLAIIEKGPGPVETRVLKFHKKRGTTSPLYESLRQKYPHF